MDNILENNYVVAPAYGVAAGLGIGKTGDLLAKFYESRFKGLLQQAAETKGDVSRLRADSFISDSVKNLRNYGYIDPATEPEKMQYLTKSVGDLRKANPQHLNRTDLSYTMAKATQPKAVRSLMDINKKALLAGTGAAAGLSYALTRDPDNSDLNTIGAAGIAALLAGKSVAGATVFSGATTSRATAAQLLHNHVKSTGREFDWTRYGVNSSRTHFRNMLRSPWLAAGLTIPAVTTSSWLHDYSNKNNSPPNE